MGLDCEIRAANLIMLKHLFKLMHKKDVNLYENILHVSRSTVDNMIARKKKLAGDQWEYRDVAKTMYMDPKVFTGERLLHINTVEIHKLIKQCEDQFKEYERSLKLRIMQARAHETSHDEEFRPCEENLWRQYFIVSDDENSNSEFCNALRDFILMELSKQIKNESFQDAQLWLFWNYIRKM
ncbi:MAG: hypothetical protein K5678_05185 [Acetatifactor sp.]|nr:hypothetical protein [Acetatifactor sp.]